MTKHVKKGLGSIIRYCNTLAPLTLLETQGVPLGNVRDFIKLDQTRQLQVAARQDNTTEKTTGLRKFKAQKQSLLTQLGKVRYKLEYLSSCVITQCILLNKGFGRTIFFIVLFIYLYCIYKHSVYI